MALFDTGRGRFFGGGGVVETNVIGDDELARSLVRLSEYIEDTTAPLLAAKAIAQADMHEKFAADTGAQGEWRPLQQETIERKSRSSTLRSHPEDVLTHTGHMERMAAHETSYRVVDDELIFTTQNLPDYWAVHEYGTGAVTSHTVFNPLTRETSSVDIVVGEGRGKSTPARPFLELTAEAEFQIAEVFEVWYEEGVNLTIHPTTGVVQERGAGGRFGRKLFPAF